MGIEQAHWFRSERCNLDRCAYCFGPVATREVVCKESDIDIAKELVRNKVRMVVLGGGEPTLARNQLEVLEILKLAFIPMG
jgi:organic radical activating enzyme